MGLTLKDLPETIKIGPYEIVLKIDPELGLRRDRLAETDHRFNEITFADTASNKGRILAETILHEVLHHIGHIYGAPVEFQDDEIINRIDKGLLDFMVHNPDLILRIIERKK